jgi:hypothetical protein
VKGSLLWSCSSQMATAFLELSASTPDYVRRKREMQTRHVDMQSFCPSASSSFYSSPLPIAQSCITLIALFFSFYAFKATIQALLAILLGLGRSTRPQIQTTKLQDLSQIVPSWSSKAPPPRESPELQGVIGTFGRPAEVALRKTR